MTVTSLVTITNNRISSECKCGHPSLIPVTAFIKKFEREVELNAVVAKSPVQPLLNKNNAGSRIVFVGGSGQAMVGTATRQETKEESYATPTQL